MYFNFKELRRFWQHWLESLGQAPGLSHDVGLDAQPADQSDWSQTGESAHELADQMHWGSTLDLKGRASRIRTSM